MSKLELAGELWSWMRVRRKWWLTPVLLFLVLLALLVVFGQSSVVAPFIYTIF